MRIVYDADAIFDEKMQVVKFAGQVLDGHGRGRFVIGHVPKETLMRHFKLRDAAPSMLLQCYAASKSEITALATQKAKLGDYHPVILPEEFPAADRAR